MFQVISNPEHRSGQEGMAEKVLSFLREGGISVIEAGTGIGKSLAYLIPSALSRKKVIISTATKNLQDQLISQDIPLLREITGISPRVTVLKGRQNYLCRRRFKMFTRQTTFPFPDAGAYLAELAAWASLTETGDRAELASLPEEFPLWMEISAHPDTCLGHRCPLVSECFLLRARNRAQSSEFVITNHHLFFTDLAIRDFSPHGLLPEVETVIFDEAHHLEEIAGDVLGISLGTTQLRRYLFRVRLISAAQRDSRIDSALTQIENSWEQINRSLPAGEYRRRIDAQWFPNEADDDLEAISGELRSLSTRLKSISPPEELEEEFGLLTLQAENLAENLTALRRREAPNKVFWAERRGTALTLHASPIAVREELEERLYPLYPNLLFTSATLSTPHRKAAAQADFSYFRSRLGISPDASAISFPSPFDFRSQALLYLPAGIPEPNDPSYPDHLGRELEKLITASRGRAFLLFTSFTNLNSVATFLDGKTPYPTFRQGDAPKPELLRMFKSEGNAVLLASMSFWSGVDVPGEPLSLVAIDRLPFDVPDEPIVQARIERIRSEGKDPFYSYQLPAAVLGLRQGIGRLIRRKSDRGVIAVLDPRIRTRGYGKMFLRSLPDMPVARNIQQVEKFFRKQVKG